jgi:hypothetical protein
MAGSGDRFLGLPAIFAAVFPYGPANVALSCNTSAATPPFTIWTLTTRFRLEVKSQ